MTGCDTGCVTAKCLAWIVRSNKFVEVVVDSRSIEPSSNFPLGLPSISSTKISLIIRLEATHSRYSRLPSSSNPIPSTSFCSISPSSAWILVPHELHTLPCQLSSSKAKRLSQKTPRSISHSSSYPRNSRCRSRIHTKLSQRTHFLRHFPSQL